MEVIGDGLSLEPMELDVSIVLAVYNERGHIVREIDRIRAAMDSSDLSYEIVVVDDGSDDGSAEELSGIRDIRLFHFAQNRGSGSARKFGTHEARGRVVVWTDVDMTYPNHRIPELVRAIEGHDQIVGARTSEQGSHRRLRAPAKWLIRRLAGYLTSTKIPDLNSGFRAFRRDVALQYTSQLPAGFSCVTTITMAFLANGYSVKYWPIEYQTRVGTSKFHWLDDTRRYILQVIRMVLSYNPLRVFLPLGFALLAVGTAKLVYDVVTPNLRVAVDTLVIIFAAFHLLMTGLLADLVGRSARTGPAVQPAAVTAVSWPDLPAVSVAPPEAVSGGGKRSSA